MRNLTTKYDDSKNKHYCYVKLLRFFSVQSYKCFCTIFFYVTLCHHYSRELAVRLLQTISKYLALVSLQKKSSQIVKVTGTLLIRSDVYHLSGELLCT